MVHQDKAFTFDSLCLIALHLISVLCQLSPKKLQAFQSHLLLSSMTFTQYCSSTFPNFTSCSFKPKKPPPKITTTPPIITDRVIDFGKYKGKMVGTLPSAYLKWVSKNLRAADFEHWARLADQVLQHPIYKDRLEWEFADSLLNGNNNIINGTDDGIGSAVSRLVEISERFGWDNEEKVGWSKVKFELLGTSKSGQIPRKSSSSSSSSVSSSEMLKEGNREMSETDAKFLSEREERRKERRERVKLKKRVDMRKEKLGFLMKKSKGGFVNRVDGEQGGDDHGDWKAGINRTSPFPGRESLLNKVLVNRQRSL